MNYEVTKRHYIGCREGHWRLLCFGGLMEVLEGSRGVARPVKLNPNFYKKKIIRFTYLFMKLSRQIYA